MIHRVQGTHINSGHHSSRNTLKGVILVGQAAIDQWKAELHQPVCGVPSTLYNVEFDLRALYECAYCIRKRRTEAARIEEAG